jgi:hypothetical protein
MAGALAAAVGGPAEARGAAAQGRRVLGTVRVWGAVEARHESGGWRALSGGALLEDTQLRTGPDGRAIIELANGDVAALGGSSEVRLTVDRFPRLALEAGRVAVRLQPSSPLVVQTPATSVALPALRRAALGGLREALITVEHGTTTVRSFRGEVEATRPGAPPVIVADNQAVTIAPPEAGTPPAPAADIEIPPGPKSPDGMWAALGLSPAMAAVIGGAVAVGGGVGGAAAAGAFSGDASTTGGTRPDQGSPFRPIRR